MHFSVNKVRPLAAWAAMLFLATGVGVAQGTRREETKTPIKHIVVIFQENVSFDHYFATYPHAENPAGEPAFHARRGTPTVNGLSGAQLTNNPNFLNKENGTGATNPFRLDHSQAATMDQNHNYGAEQEAVDFGLMDLFPKWVGRAGPPPNAPPIVDTKGITMGYYDGNTVTALWNYAQHFAMSDNSYGTTFGPSTVGVLNLVSGQTNGARQTLNGSGDETDGGDGTLTVIGDPDPLGDRCSKSTRNQVRMGGRNIGELLNDAGVTWGAFMGGFDLRVTNANGTTNCDRSSKSLYTGTQRDYVPHHAFFQYYKTTANLDHTPPNSIKEIGHPGPANHQYDLEDFYAAVKSGNFPAVNFLKGIAIQDGHAGNSDPLDEQEFIVKVVNFLEKTPEWSSTAVVVMYDDSDGWYDHQMGPIMNQSASEADELTGHKKCGDGSAALPGIDAGNAHAQGRCGYGPRLPLLVVSPWARENFVDHSVTDQTSVIRFIEDNWLGGKRIGGGSFDAISNSIEGMFDFERRRLDGRLFLDPKTGDPLPKHKQ